jgi:very-short-patch-repair endonuclease
MLSRNIVIGQKVEGTKVARAKELRRQMTREERILWQHLRANRLRGKQFRRQQIIDGFIVDFYCHAAGLAVELDGSSHIGRVEYDGERDQILSARGLRILRIQDVRDNLPVVLAEIAALLEQEGTPCNKDSPPRFGEGPGEGLIPTMGSEKGLTSGPEEGLTTMLGLGEASTPPQRQGEGLTSRPGERSP